MQANIMKVKSCSEQFYVKSEKADNGQMAKRNLVLQEIGGKFENSYLVAVLGNLAGCQFYEGEASSKTLTLWQSLATLPDASSTKAM